MSHAHLRFSSSILKRIGEELNPNLDQGILELVKNAYDADALHCTIELENTRGVGGTLRVSDDGDGMMRQQIEEGWLVMGSSSKSIDKQTRLGRIPVGNKGLGRIAALRMGAIASLLTRPKANPTKEYALDIEWDRFDESLTVEDVDLEVVERPRANDSHPKTQNGTEHHRNDEPGTIITISRLRSSLTLQDIRRLARGLLLLADPFGDDPQGFRPILKTPEFQELEDMVKRRYFEEADYHLIAEVDYEGRAHARVVDWRGQELYTTNHSTLRRKDNARFYECPAARFDLWSFNLNAETFTSNTANITRPQLSEWLGYFGGIHLYIRGFRVPPYGNPGNDWLEMNLKRVIQPKARASTNNTIGRVTLEDPQERLFQKTDRSGLIEDETFQELKQFASDAVSWMNRQIVKQSEARRDRERVEAPKFVADARSQVRQAIQTLPAEQQRIVLQRFDAYDKKREKEVETVRNEVQLYRTLSTAGITAAVFAHEAGQPVTNIDSDMRTLRKNLKRELGERYTGFGASIDRVRGQIDLLKSFGTLTLDLLSRAKRRRHSQVKVHKTIRDVLQTFDPIMLSRHVSVKPLLEPGVEPFLLGSEAALESIVTNLIINSLRAFEHGPPGERVLAVETYVAGSTIDLWVKDSGPGIQGIDIDSIWLPGETFFDKGTGLGLTIVRDTVRDLGGSVRAIAKGELGGAEFGVTLPILGTLPGEI